MKKEEIKAICSNCDEEIVADDSIFIDLTNTQLRCPECDELITEQYLEEKMNLMGTDEDLLNSGLCFICNDKDGDETLVNGVKYHQECYEKLIEEKKELDVHRFDQEFPLNKLKQNLTAYGRVINFFKGIKREEIEEKIKDMQQDIDSRSCRLEVIKLILRNLYDFWPRYLNDEGTNFDQEERKSDWEKRKEVVKDYYNRRCVFFGRHYGLLHIHHKRKLSKGGDHRFKNLIPLCKKHHEFVHGGRKFDYGSKSNQTKFHEHLSILQEAIAGGIRVYFSYRKDAGERSKRTIEPERIVRIGRQICVKGFCFLRDEERVFNIKRIKTLKITNEIIKGADY